MLAIKKWKEKNEEAINANKSRKKKINSRGLRTKVLKVLPDLKLHELNPPKRPLSAYLLYSIKVRPQIVLENPELKGIKAAGKIS